MSSGTRVFFVISVGEGLALPAYGTEVLCLCLISDILPPPTLRTSADVLRLEAGASRSRQFGTCQHKRANPVCPTVPR